ncbi:MAG: NAD(P)H-binding protein [Fibrobacteres bacterium]|nr:NAD(P)H-binding protein [Fibrobacterota bacterium]
MGLKVVVTGATGMVGKAVLLECLDSAAVEQVLAIGRRPIGMKHPKLSERLLADMSDPASIADALSGVDACYFCLGVSSMGMSEAEYSRLTYDLTLGFAKALAASSPQAVFCYVSGAGTDSSEKGKRMWARVKGKTENALQRLPFKAAYNFRPGFIRPMRGVASRTKTYQVLITLFRPLFPLLALSKAFATDSVTLGRAMLYVTQKLPEGRFVESVDINRYGKAG